MNNILIVTYSRSETTELVARALAEALGAERERIQTPTNRLGALGYALSATEALAKGLPTIKTSIDPSSFDLVVLGTPVWTGTMSAPMRSYLFLNRTKLPRRLGFFATMGGRGAEATMLEMQMLCGVERAPMQAFVESEVKRARHRAGVASLVSALMNGAASAVSGLDARERSVPVASRLTSR